MTSVDKARKFKALQPHIVLSFAVVGIARPVAGPGVCYSGLRVQRGHSTDDKTLSSLGKKKSAFKKNAF